MSASVNRTDPFICFCIACGFLVKNLSASAGNMRPGFDPGVRKTPWRRARQPTQYACLENPMDRGAWWATEHGVTQSWTRVSDVVCIARTAAFTL